MSTFKRQRPASGPAAVDILEEGVNTEVNLFDLVSLRDNPFQSCIQNPAAWNILSHLAGYRIA